MGEIEKMNGKLKAAIVAKYGKCSDCSQFYNRRDNKELNGKNGERMKQFLSEKVRNEGIILENGLCPYHEALRFYRSFD